MKPNFVLKDWLSYEICGCGVLCISDVDNLISFVHSPPVMEHTVFPPSSTSQVVREAYLTVLASSGSLRLVPALSRGFQTL